MFYSVRTPSSSEGTCPCERINGFTFSFSSFGLATNSQEAAYKQLLNTLTVRIGTCTFFSFNLTLANSL